ncbi:MAG: efflux RND transporter permease subunit [Planctomycetota bacterium]|nr:MAG: efflux RND transporter permease subunit [Planctomycetota bacterium]
MAADGPLALGVRRPVGMLMLFTAVVVFGVVSLGKLPFDLLPDVDYPSLTVRTVYPGAAPEDLEERVTERIEDALATVGGVVRMRSSSRAEVSEVLLEFEWGSNLAFLVQDVRERLDRVFLPAGVERPLILRYDPALDPVMRIALSSDRADLVRLRDLAEQEVERELEGLPGVAAVKVRGGLEDEIQVQVDPQKLASFRLTPELVRQRLEEENLNVPGGTVEEGAVEYTVRTLNEFRSLADIADLPLVRRGNGTIELGDVARVVRAARDRDVILRVAGAEAVEIDVYREAGANIVAVSERVRERLLPRPPTRAERARAEKARRLGRPEPPRPRSIAEKLPDDLRLTILSDQALFVRGAIDEVRDAALAGGILAILVVFLFLRRLAATAVIGLAIPVSILSTFGAMYLAGVSLNVMSLGGLALGIGMLVDNAIVVLESIERCRAEGDPPLAAAVRGVREVGAAVTASTLTTIAVFAPIVFVEGVAGQTFGDQALTVVASLLLSLAVALFFIPGLAARLDRRPAAAPGDAAAPAETGRRARLFPRSRRLFAGLRRPRRWLPAALVAAICTGAALFLFGAARAELAPRLAEFPAGGRSGMAALPPEVRSRVAALQFGGFVLLLPLLWLAGEPLLVVLGRFLADLAGLLFLFLRGLGLVVSAPVWLLLQVPALLVGGLQSLLEKTYPAFLRRALRAPLLVLLIVAALGWSSWRAAAGLGRELLPEVLQGELTAELFFPAGSPLEETDRLAAELERRIRRIDGVVETAVLVGADRESTRSDEDGPHVARVTVRTRPGAAARATELAVEAGIRRLLAREPALARFEIRRPTLLALEAPLEVEVLGEDLDALAEAARRVEHALRGVPGIADLRTSVRRGNPEVLVSLDRERLAEHGLNLGQVAQRLRLAVEGEVGSTFPEEDERLDIRVRADLSRMQHVEQLRDLPVNPEAERPLPLAAVATLTTGYGPSEIRHVGKRRAAVVAATLTGAGLDLGGVARRIEERLAKLELPPGVGVRVAGQKEEMEKALGSLLFALILAVFLVYAVMAAQFESLLQPFVILFSVPLAGVGAVWALRLAGERLSVVALLGCVVLAGIVVNNAIVLIDRVNRNRRRGLDLDQAIVEAGRTRLRPILMTTLTTVLGMLPLTGWLPELPLIGSIGGAEGTELRAPMALVVIAGLSVSTLLTLVVVPVLYRLAALAAGRSRA